MDIQEFMSEAWSPMSWLTSRETADVSQTDQQLLLHFLTRPRPRYLHT